MVTDEEAQSLLKKDQDNDQVSTNAEHSNFSSAKISTPVFGHLDWWILNITCLVTITFLSIWQVSTKAAMTINLESDPGEVDSITP
jgi:hypothetical protein